MQNIDNFNNLRIFPANKTHTNYYFIIKCYHNYMYMLLYTLYIYK